MESSRNLTLRELKLKDLEDYYHWNLPCREFHKFNGPYFKKYTEDELAERISGLRSKLLNGETNVLERKKMIVDSDTDKILGEVNWYWKSEETLWLEIGIVVFNEDYWGKNIGYHAMKAWISEIFSSNAELVRLGLTTWSGNTRMMKLAEKLGFKCEAVYRKARIVENQHYDSISYGLLREEWEEMI